ncbi:MAG: crotonase/enoyl-CoA hydratase family protein, partial [Stagnimonas sp.]|nr:crotonase/enoyl-CoA hydratase family protein [Stagnimonas sp.]
TAHALHAAFLAFEDNAEARVAVFHGAHGHFCAGWDLQYGARLAASGDSAGLDLDFAANDPHALGPMGPSRLQLSKPVIAAVSGAAVAGGMELALWCDMRVMEEDAYFGVYCRRFGVPLIDGGTVRLPRLIGMSRALDLILTGRPVAADEALQMGLANRVVPAGEALVAAEQLALQIAAFPQTCMRGDRQSAYQQWGMDEAAAISNEFAHGKKTLQSGETVAGAGRFSSGTGRHGQF